MPDKMTDRRAEWPPARDGLAELQAEQAERNREINRTRLELPREPAEKTVGERCDGCPQV